MTPSDTILSIMTRIYGYEMTEDRIKTGLPVLQDIYSYALTQFNTLVKEEVDSATAPLYNEIVRIKALVAATAASVAQKE